MIRLHAEFDSLGEAELWRDGMYAAYPPQGYSTHLVITRATRVVDGVTEEVWVAYGSRAASCD
jgi:hypothetical protein